MAVLPVVVVWLVAMSPMLIGGRVLLSADLCSFSLPMLHAVRDAWLSGSATLWDPWIAGGFPLFAEGQAAPVYPVTLALLPFSAEIGMNLSIALHVLLLGVGTVVYVRDLGLGRCAAAFSGTMFMLSAPVMARMIHLPIIAALAWMPWVFCAGRRMVHGPRRWAVVAGLLLGVQVLAGHPQPIWIELLALAPYLVLEAGRAQLRLAALAASVLGAAAVAIAVAAAPLLARLELMTQSIRAHGMAASLVESFPPRQLLTFVVPYAFGVPSRADGYWGAVYFWETATYVGLGGLAFAVIGAWRDRRRHVVRLFAAVVVATVVLSFGSYFAPSAAILTTAPLSYFRASGRFLLLTAFALAVLAAFGVEAAVSAAPAVRRRFAATLAAVAGAFVLILGAAHVVLLAAGTSVLDFGHAYHDWRLAGAPDPQRAAAFARVPAIYAGLLDTTSPVRPPVLVPVAALIASAAALSSSRLRSQSVVGGLLVAGLGVDLLVFTSTFVDWTERLPAREPPFAARLTAHGDSRVLSVAETFTDACRRVCERLPPNTPRLYGIGFLGVVSPLALDAPEVALRVSRGDDRLDDRCERLSPRLLTVWSVTHVVCRGAVRGGAEVVASWPPDETIRLYALDDPLPRAYVVPRARAVGSAREAATLLAGGVDPRATVLITGSAASRAGQGGHGTASIEVTQALRTRLRVRSDGPAWLVVNDAYYPGWHASVDGTETPIHRANGFVRAIPVETGEHVVEMRYRPRWLVPALGVSGFTLVASALLLRPRAKSTDNSP